MGEHDIGTFDGQSSTHHDDLLPQSKFNSTKTGGKESGNIYVKTDAGTLVYERLDFGRRLIGFEDVTDWEQMRIELARRGHGTGALYDLPEWE